MSDGDPLQERVFRSRVADFLFGLSYPATRQAIILRGRHNNTASQITEALTQLPDRTYTSLDEIQATITYVPPRVWDVEGFPAAAIRHDEIEAERIRRNIQQADRSQPRPR